MDESKYAAHMAEDGRIQTLAEHHRGTASCRLRRTCRGGGRTP